MMRRAIDDGEQVSSSNNNNNNKNKNKKNSNPVRAAFPGPQRGRCQGETPARRGPSSRAAFLPNLRRLRPPHRRAREGTVAWRTA